MTDEELKNKCKERAKIFQQAMESCKSSNLMDCIEWFADRIADLEKENAGLKAGRPKWHEVADGDLPKKNMKQAIVKTSDGDKYMGWYCTHQGKWWHDECPNPDDEISGVIEWCELP